MMENQRSFSVPILFILFNRPEHARRVLERIKQIQPSQLFVTIDGPRNGNLNDEKNVQSCRDLLNEIDWPCKVETLIRNENLGCKRAVSSAISWFFEQVEYGIILEDDCLPDITFFSFCEVLLKKYENTPSIMHIGGSNLYGGHKWSEDSYFFSIIPHIWGWATWRRAWALYDVDMKKYPQYKKDGGIKKSVTYSPSRSFWENSFDGVYAGNIDTWDYQWVFCVWVNQGLCIIPSQNLVSNIGFGAEATHTTSASEQANLATISVDVAALRHPGTLRLNKEAVKYAFANFYRSPSIWHARMNRLKKLFFTYFPSLFFP